MTTLWIYSAILVATACERLAELVVSKRNAAWAFARGGVEYGKAHFPYMVVLHTVFLIGCLLEPWVFDRPFLLWLALPMLALAIAAQGLRWWVITTLGPRWNTRVIIVPGLPLIQGGPYRWLKHPNYLAVVVEGFALPLIHSAWVTAIAFTVLNAFVLFVRIRVENKALAEGPQMEKAGEIPA